MPRTSLLQATSRARSGRAQNHGVFYDRRSRRSAYVATARSPAADRVYTPSARPQNQRDCRQPEELDAPAAALRRSASRVRALAELGRHVGVDLWRGRAAGGSMRAALKYVAPYADPATPFQCRR